MWEIGECVYLGVCVVCVSQLAYYMHAIMDHIDLKNPKTNTKTAGFTQEERDGFTALLGEGFVDTFRHLHPDRQAFTYWSYRFNARTKNIGW